jgi:molybdate transport system substrate-binding protein
MHAGPSFLEAMKYSNGASEHRILRILAAELCAALRLRFFLSFDATFGDTFTIVKGYFSAGGFMKNRLMVGAIFMATLALLAAGAAPPGDITVLGGMGVVSGLHDLAPAFERMTGHKVIVQFEQNADLSEKIASGVAADIAAVQPQQVDDFIKQGKMVAGTKTNFAQAGVGVAVKAGAARPDISTVEAFKAAMLKAKSIGYSHGGSGIISAKVMEKLGIADQLKAKTKFIDGIPVADVVAKGEVEIGLQQINVIVPVKGADYVGPLPKELQETVKFAAALLPASKQPETAKALLKFIASTDAAPLLRKSAMEPWR